ncbi:MAG TPA: hypothetical protein DFS52_22665 [Myxococcales bacterium]|nr:hypothetical protein [Myxococcales bacterium]
MSKDLKKLERLARELASLSSEERAQVLALAERRQKLRPPPRGWRPKVLTGSTHWDAGSLRREELYDDDGR